MTKRIIVTGASRGIGFELVKQYTAQGHQVIAISRNTENLARLKQECLQLNAQAVLHTISFDLASGDFHTALIPFVSKHFQQVDVLINNAGALVSQPFSEITASDLQRVYQVNVLAVFQLTQVLLPKFSESAHIVNVSSVGGLQGSVKFAGLSAYSSSKAALVSSPKPACNSAALCWGRKSLGNGLPPCSRSAVSLARRSAISLFSSSWSVIAYLVSWLLI